MKLGLSEHNIEIYCEKSENIKSVKIDNKGSFFIGNAEIRNGEELFLVSPFGEINLSQTGSDAFVINSNGELIYQLAKPQSITSATVFATPSGERYHRDISCAGRAAFEVSQKTAELFGRTPCKLCIE